MAYRSIRAKPERSEMPIARTMDSSCPLSPCFFGGIESKSVSTPLDRSALFPLSTGCRCDSIRTAVNSLWYNDRQSSTDEDPHPKHRDRLESPA